MFGTAAGSGAGRGAACGEWSPAPPSLNGRPGTALRRGQTLVLGAKPSEAHSCRCSRHAIRPAGAAEGDPMQVWAPRIVSLPSLPSPGPRSPQIPAPRCPLPSQPLCSVYLCLLSPPASAERHLGRRWRSWSLILGDSSPSSQIPVVCTLTFCPWSSVPRFMAWCSSVSGFNTHRQDSEKPRGLDLFSNVPFPQLRIKATRRVGNQELFLVRS